MFKPLHQYFRDEVRPRWYPVVVSWESLIAICVGAAFAHWGASLFSSYPRVSDITTGLIAYSAIALGFCVAGLTISLTFPEPKFTLLLVTPPKGKSRNHYSDLIFIFSWTAVAHWVALMVLFCAVLFTDGTTAILPAEHSALRIWAVGLLATICTYCLCQFLIAVITLSQVGNLYVAFLVKKLRHED